MTAHAFFFTLISETKTRSAKEGGINPRALTATLLATHQDGVEIIF